MTQKRKEGREEKKRQRGSSISGWERIVGIIISPKGQKWGKTWKREKKKKWGKRAARPAGQKGGQFPEDEACSTPR